LTRLPDSAAARRVSLLLLLGSLLGDLSHAAGDAACKALLQRDFGQTLDAPARLTAAALVEPDGGVPAHCKLEGYVAPQVGLELRLPASDWNGKLLTQGCGAMCGMMLGSEACAEAVSRGYACVTTDMGHRGLPYDGKWAYNNPVAEIDLGHRATHVATLAARAVVEAYYSAAPQRSYFRGCSTGGRQALVAAQRYPYDYDGIIGGAIVFYQLMGPPLQLFWGSTVNLDRQGKPILDVAKLPMLAKAVLAACDANDGVRDGVIDNPLQCQFKPETLRCGAQLGAECLAEAEVAVVQKMYAGPMTSQGVKIMQSGQLPGSELAWDSYFRGGKASPNYGFGAEILRYLAFPTDPGPAYDLTDFNWDRDPQRLSLSMFTAGNPDLRLFRDAGGKLLMFHGLADPAVFATSTIAYYDLATRTMGGRKDMDAFARLFLLPGLYHCRGGPGTNYADMLGALEQWVERGVAPDMIMGHHQKNDARGPADPPVRFDPKTAEFSRPIFPYPDRAVYQGAGDWKDPGSYQRRPGSSRFP
jgi:hypothetical protein